MMTIDTFLHRLCKAIKNKTTKSKQTAFDLFYSDITEAKKYYSWDQIADHINKSTGDNVAASAYRNMLTRTKNKKLIPGEHVPDIHPINKQQVSHENSESMPIKNASDMNSYLTVCFNNERLATRAIEGGVSIAQIKEWQCPNAIRLGTTLSNYLQNK